MSPQSSKALRARGSRRISCRERPDDACREQRDDRGAFAYCRREAAAGHVKYQGLALSELVELLKSKPGKLNFSSAGFGTPSHLIGEMFAVQAGVHATHVPYQQFSQAISDLIGGNVQYMFVTTLPVIDLIATGKLRALAVTAPTRIAALKDVPSVVEAGFPDLVTADWIGFAAKRGTPVEITSELNRVLVEPKMVAALEKIGAVPVGGTAAEFGDGIRSDVAHWAKVIKDADIKLPQ